jgi:hypothetical protein
MSNDKVSKKRKQAEEAPEKPEEKKKTAEAAEADGEGGDEKKSKRGGPRRLVRRADEGPYRSELVSLKAIRDLSSTNAGVTVTVSSALASQIDYMFRTLAAQVAARAVRIAKDSARGETRAVDKPGEAKEDGKPEEAKKKSKEDGDAKKKDGKSGDEAKKDGEEAKKSESGPTSVVVNSKMVIEAFMDAVRAHMYREVPRPKTKAAAIHDLHATAMETDEHARDEADDLRDEMVRAMKVYTQFRRINGELADKVRASYAEDKTREGANLKELKEKYKKRLSELSIGDRATRKHLEICVSVSTTREILRAHVAASQILRNTATVALAAGLSHLLTRVCGGMGSLLNAQRTVAKAGPKENRRLNMDHLTGSFVVQEKRTELKPNGKEREVEVSVARYPMLWNTFFKTLPLNTDICRALADTPVLAIGANMPLLANTFLVEADA